MAFRSNGLGYGQHACIVCRNKAMSRKCVCAGMRINAMCGVFLSWPRKTRFFHFSSASRFLCVKQVHGHELGLMETRAQR
jgi:hypothetical protein